jgi:tetratricopeptide (TPR) repeat protein
LVVVLEDLQWAEDSLLDLLGYVSSTAADVPLVLVCTARPELDERRPTWGSAGADAMTIRLEALGGEETDELLSGLLGIIELDPSARDRIAAFAEGNPLFLEEILSILIDDGHLQEREGRWEPSGDLGAVPIPPTVKALLDARVDRLSSPERDVLEAAAIVGRGFDLEDLSDLRPDTDPGDVVEILDALCRRDLLDLRRFTSRGSSSYAFRHLLIRDVAYAAIPRNRRARDHERFGRAVAERAGDRLREVDEIVGYHLEAAFDLRQGSAGERAGAAALGDLAAAHLAAAGRRAFARDDATAAASLFGRALNCLGDDDRLRSDLSRLRGAALFDLGRFDEARGVLLRGLDAADRSGDGALRWRLQLELMELDVYTRPGDRAARETQVFADEAVTALAELGDAAGLARAYRLLGEALTLQGHLDEGLEAFEQGMRYAVEAGDEREVALPQRLMGLHGTTPLSVFIAQCEQLMANPTRRPRPEVVMRMAFAHALAGHEAEAHLHVEQGLALAREVGGPFRVADAELYAGLALLHLGESSEAALLLENAQRRLAELGEQNLRSTVLAIFGESLFRLGRLDEADAAAEQSRQLAAEDDWASQLLWRQVRAKVLAVRGDTQAACALITESTQIADRTDFLTMAAFAHLDSSEVFGKAGDADTASRERELGMSLFARKGVADRVAELVRDHVKR